MLASKTWKRSEVPAKKYSPSYNSSTNSSLPKLLLKHNGLIQKNICILYLFQISETARPKDIYMFRLADSFASVTVKILQYSNTWSFLAKNFSKNYMCWFYLSWFLRFGLARIFLLQLTVELNHYTVHMCTCINLFQACTLLIFNVQYK